MRAMPSILLPRVAVGLLALVLLGAGTAEAGKSGKKNKEYERAQSKCNKCSEIVNTFYKRYNETDTIQFRGESKGWTTDNEKFLGKYKMGEARLAEMMEKICSKSDDKCNELLIELEEEIEGWWEKRNESDKSFYNLESALCITKAKLCCQSGKYGKKCTKCPGYDAKTQSVCSGHGVCHGQGIRGGTGKCTCNTGWVGKECSKCKKGYFKTRDDSGMICQKCNEACLTCDGPSADDCKSCAAGYEQDDSTCKDINECNVSEGTNAEKVCPDAKTFCRNTPGSFSCDQCSNGCADPENNSPWCTGSSDADCAKCAEGYKPLESGGCVDINECENPTNTCEANQYCQNLPGSFKCQPCSSTCSDEGCNGSTAKDCLSCKEGFTADGNNEECKDINECKGFPCPELEDCENKDGSYKCVCTPPNAKNVDSGECERPDGVRLPVGLSEEMIDKAVAAYENLPKGTLQHKATSFVGGSPTAIKVTHVIFNNDDFKTAGKLPIVDFVQGKEVCCGDTFGFDATNITNEGFDLISYRTDTQSGWGQEISIEWAAHIEKDRTEL